MEDWTVPKLKDELKKRDAQIPSDTIKLKLLTMLIHSLILERQQRGCIGRIGRIDHRGLGALIRAHQQL